MVTFSLLTLALGHTYYIKLYDIYVSVLTMMWNNTSILPPLLCFEGEDVRQQAMASLTLSCDHVQVTHVTTSQVEFHTFHWHLVKVS
jgi:hypothetical protein